MRRDMKKKFDTTDQMDAEMRTDLKSKMCKTTVKDRSFMRRYRIQSVIRCTITSRHLLKVTSNTYRSMTRPLQDIDSRDAMLILARTNCRSQNDHT